MFRFFQFSFQTEEKYSLQREGSPWCTVFDMYKAEDMVRSFDGLSTSLFFLNCSFRLIISHSDKSSANFSLSSLSILGGVGMDFSLGSSVVVGAVTAFDGSASISEVPASAMATRHSTKPSSLPRARLPGSS